MLKSRVALQDTERGATRMQLPALSPRLCLTRWSCTLGCAVLCIHKIRMNLRALFKSERRCWRRPLPLLVQVCITAGQC